MLSMLTTPDLTLLFLGVVVGLGTAFVWMLWEIEQMSRCPNHVAPAIVSARQCGSFSCEKARGKRGRRLAKIELVSSTRCIS
jgi:hypothetical protein